MRLPFRTPPFGDVIVIEGTSFFGVECHFDEARPWNKATPDQTAVIRGVFEPTATRPYLTGCVVVKAEGPKPLEVSVEEFQADHVKDLDAAKKKYEAAKYVVLAGELQLIDDKTVLVFKTKEPAPKIEAAFTGAEEFVVKDFKPGAKLKVMSDYPSFGVSKDRVRLTTCVMMEISK